MEERILILEAALRPQAASDQEDDIRQRLSVVEASLRVQHAVGASHLQQLELCPAAFGLSSSARPAVKSLRQKRNAALHCDFGPAPCGVPLIDVTVDAVGPTALTRTPVSAPVEGPGQVPKLPPPLRLAGDQPGCPRPPAAEAAGTDDDTVEAVDVSGFDDDAFDKWFAALTGRADKHWRS